MLGGVRRLPQHQVEDTRTAQHLGHDEYLLLSQPQSPSVV